MAEDLRLILNPHPRSGGAFPFLSEPALKEVHEFHRGMDGYAPTPLLSMRSLAESLGVSEFLVKDESKRFGLNAFKVLGGSWAMGKYVCGRLGLPVDENSFSALCSGRYSKALESITFVTATDGNHGRGVAWTAMMLGCRAVVYLPEGSARERLENILALGAHGEIMPFNYDGTVRHAKKMAEENGWVLLQDTSLPGYEEMPRAIMQGYTTMACEIDSQLRSSGRKKPTHLFLQAGVGSMAGAVAGCLVSLWRADCPKIIIVEPDKADCIFRTAEADDGRLHTVSGSMDSMMAGLCCGEPCSAAWEILRDTACAFISCSDDYSAFGMRLLAHPYGDDSAVVSGESGAVTAGVAAGLMAEAAFADMRAALGLSSDSRILVISTEGDTDRENYLRITRSI